MSPTNLRWQPTCSLEMLRLRSRAMQAVRQFFDARQYLEVDTPCVSQETVVDAWLEPPQLSSTDRTRYLQTSPEALMKRLLAAGSGSIWQAARVFRNDESGQRHNFEFTMLEWYGVNTTWRQQIQVTEELIRNIFTALQDHLPDDLKLQRERAFRVTTFREAFQRTLNCDPHSCPDEVLHQLAVTHTSATAATLQHATRDDLLNLLLGFVIEPRLGQTNGKAHPEFLCDYPASQAALATIETVSKGTRSYEVAKRFELYIHGTELCNGYQELQDPEELHRRDQQANCRRQQDQRSVLPGAPRLIAAMQHGFPACSGVALGFDRLMMLATGTNTIAEVIPFAADHA